MAQRAIDSPSGRSIATPHALPFDLYPYQREGVRQLLEWGARGILADDMGLGKTRQAIAVLSAVRASGRALVFTLASLKFNWQSELATLLPDLRVFSLDHASDDIPPNAAAAAVIVSYTLAVRADVQKKLQAVRWSMLIADESHSVKNPAAKCTKFVLKLAAKTPYVVLLSGTPMSRPKDLWTQINAVRPGMFGKAIFPAALRLRPMSYRALKDPNDPTMTFGERYCVPKPKHGPGGRMFIELNGAASLDELHRVLTRTCMIHRRKLDVLHDLPDKTREHQIIARDPVRFEVPDAAKFNFIAEAVRALSARKRQHIIKYLKDVVVPMLLEDGTKKLIVFCNYHDTTDAILELMREEHIAAVQYDGRTLRKQAALDDFRDRAQVAVMGIKAAGVGLNITFCDWVVFAELLYGADDHLQAEDRCYRIGQQNNVLCQYMIIENSVDELLWGMIQKKARSASNVLHGTAKGLHSSRKRARTDSDDDDADDADDAADAGDAR